MRNVTYITKVLLSELRTVAINFFFLTNSTCLVIKRALIVVYDFQFYFESSKLNFVLLKMKKNISRAIPIPMLASKKVSLKHHDFFTLFSISKIVIIILNISNYFLSFDINFPNINI